MGAGESKPEIPGKQHVFQSPNAPVRFSGELVDSLQRSSESDTTRLKNLEYQIQSRVKSELERLQAAESSRLAEISKRLSDEPSAPTEPAPSPDAEPRMRSPLLNPPEEKPQKPEQTHDTVQAEIAALRKKLEGRRKLEQADEGVEQARSAVVQCLRTNDRKPLDCWQEVESFRKEVGRLEKDFVERTVR
ncbi:DUF1690-domain-containing protein [Rhizodiscina lignyota]|uniref:DUF1690-domain-containing protein n=1 Tax=Rhizodiscina lignyota TaxID=1504668 RepID=A0A9P4IAI7_9PEZI|nr:DUF1690-domain-containing protein [Rhizodiscina lignyota]